VRTAGWLSLVPTRVLVWAAFSDDYGSKSVRDELLYRRFASNHLGLFDGSSIGQALRTLESDPRPDARDFAGSLIAWLGARDRRVTPALLGALEDPVPAVRVRAIRSLGIYLARADLVVPRLTAVVADTSEHPSVRSEAAGVLGVYGSRARSAREALLTAMRDADAQVVTAAADAMGRVEVDAATAVPALLSLLRDPPPQHGWDPETARWWAIIAALGSFEEAAPEIVPRLLRILETTPNPEARYDLITALGRLGSSSIAAAPAIRRYSLDPEASDETVVMGSAALEVIEGREPDLATALARVLLQDDRLHHEIAAKLLGRLGRDAAPAMPIILDVFRSSTDGRVLMILCSSIWSLREHGQAALPVLLELRERWPDPMVDYAINAIERVETKAQPSGP
jgi:HEAT repeat protein